MGSIGQLIGAFLFPSLAERYGRGRFIAWCSGIIGLTSIACGFAPSFAVFVVFVALRMAQGLGLGGELPVAANYINEITRAHGRGRFVLLFHALGAVPLLAELTVHFLGIETKGKVLEQPEASGRRLQLRDDGPNQMQARRMCLSSLTSPNSRSQRYYSHPLACATSRGRRGCFQHNTRDDEGSTLAADRDGLVAGYC